MLTEVTAIIIWDANGHGWVYSAGTAGVRHAGGGSHKPSRLNQVLNATAFGDSIWSLISKQLGGGNVSVSGFALSAQCLRKE